ncbi:NtaA/DmoA family FMN-dependent monooxygenase [Pseudonocardia sp. NPDC049635]|uniref:NtaA/DmoA family FMN-dependent monooxygenase n=1 Tax=Pseudonocardia sp. NPDC049635 TaxID=3155506 RepID=UPI0033D1A6A8
MFHLGWFVGHGISASGWRDFWAGDHGHTWMRSDVYLDLVRSMERAGFDYVMLEDSSLIPDVYQGSTRTYLQYGMSAPKNDPVTLVPLLGSATRHLGIVATVTTSLYPPFLAARMLASLDHLTEGRVGANLVTAHNARAAQNYGRPALLAHDERYAMAREWVEVVTRLFASWEPDAMVVDPQEPMLVDHTKVHPIDFEGSYFSCRGPLNTVPGPQGRPVFCQAGGSPAGREFAAQVADTVIGGHKSVDAMRSYRADMSERMTAHGRKPDDCKVLMTVVPTLGETVEEAQERKRRQQAAAGERLDQFLAAMSYTTGLDMATFDLDAPLDQGLTTDAAQSVLADYLRLGQGKTLREIALGGRDAESSPFVGTPDAVASAMGEVITETGADGYLIANPIDRRSVSEICDGLVPALRKRGLVRTAYEGATFRDNLLAF